MKPSNSTIASAGLGLPVAIVTAWLAGQFGLDMTAEVQTAFGVIISTVIGYFFEGGKKAAASDANSQSGFAHPGLLVMIVIATLVGLSGCVTNRATGKQELTATGKVALQEIAGLAIERGVRNSPRAAEISARIRKVAVELQGMTEEVTVAELKARLQKRINKLEDPYDRSDLTRVLNIASALITDYVGQGKLDSAAMVKVNEYVGYLVAALPSSTQPVLTASAALGKVVAVEVLQRLGLARAC